MSIYSNLYIKFSKQKGLPVRNSPFLNSHIISLVFHRWILTNSLSAMKCHKNICTTTILLISQIQYGLRIRYPLHPPVYLPLRYKADHLSNKNPYVTLTFHIIHDDSA